MEKISISDLLIRIKNSVVIEDKVQYKRVTIKSKNAGIVLRDIKYGHDIGTKKQFIINKGQFLLSKIDARNGAFGIVGQELDGAIITGNFWTYEVNKERLNIEWFNIFVSSSKFISICDKASSGTTNRRYLDESKFLNYQINLPSLNEQNIFVKKYKELSSKLDLINNKINIEKKYLKKLRNSILEDAVQGKLVEQDPNDEPAEVLLEKIKEDKQRLVKEKKIKKEKPLSDINEYEKTIKLSRGWSYCKLGQISFITKLAGFEYTKYIKLKDEGDIPVIRAQNVKMINLNKTNLKYIDLQTSLSLERSALTRECLLMTFIGAGIGDVALFSEKERYHLAPNVAKIEMYVEDMDKYIMYYLISPIGRLQVFKNLKATAQPSLSMQTIRDVNIILPPLEEQKRIVEKVDSLMALCDELEKKIEEQKEYSNKLMESIIKNSF